MSFVLRRWHAAACIFSLAFVLGPDYPKLQNSFGARTHGHLRNPNHVVTKSGVVQNTIIAWRKIASASRQCCVYSSLGLADTFNRLCSIAGCYHRSTSNLQRLNCEITTYCVWRTSPNTSGRRNCGTQNSWRYWNAMTSRRNVWTLCVYALLLCVLHKPVKIYQLNHSHSR